MGPAAGQSLLPFIDLTYSRPEQTKVKKPARQFSMPRRSIEQNTLSALCDSPNRVLFLDIETTGLSRHYDELTLVGWLYDSAYNVHVIGDDPEPLLSSLRAASAIVTFNGTLFDLPFLSKAFPDLSLPKIHADLRFLARRAGLTGGQKTIEDTLGINVRGGVEDIDGAQAVLLWHRYLRGDLESLRQLINYNRCDVIAMRYILDELLERLVDDPDFWFPIPRFSEDVYSLSGQASPSADLPHASRLNRPTNTFQSLFAGTVAETATVVGIDLTGSESRPSGWCLLRGARAETEMVATDDEMIDRITSISPTVVSIDSPLSLPFGRIRVEDDDPGRAEFGIMRLCERELKRRGINVYPCLLPSMQGLTLRGMRLANRLRRLGVPVIESYPGAAQDIMSIPRKGTGEAFLKAGLKDFGVSGHCLVDPVRHDELDAITSAIVGSFFLSGKYEALAEPSGDALIIPDLKAVPSPLAVGISGRICAGKTTAARLLEGRGFAYTRFSLAVDDEIMRRGELPSRESRQRVGLEISHTKGQRWLCHQTLARVSHQPLLVIDGLRFLEDRAFLLERFGSRFLHLHVTAPTPVRKNRYQQGSGPTLEQAEANPVEGEIDRVGAMAALVVENSSTLDSLEARIASAVTSFVRKVGEECRFQSS